jgi:hypothetical protein
MTRAIVVVVVALAVAACSAGVRTRYRGAPPSPCGGVRPYTPAIVDGAPCQGRRP